MSAPPPCSMGPVSYLQVALLFLAGAAWATPMNSNVKTFWFETPGHGQPLGFFRQLNVKNSLTRVTIKMTMFCHIRAKMRRASVESDLPNQTAFHQGIQTVVNGRHRNIRHTRFGADKHPLGCWMIPFIQQNRINMFALGSEAKTATRQPIIQFCFLVSHRPHDSIYDTSQHSGCQYLE